MFFALVRPVALLSTRHIPAARPRSQRTLVSPGAGHGQGPLPRDREDSIGMPFARFQRALAVLPQGSITRRCAPFRCFRPVFSVRGSWCGSKRDPRFLFAVGKGALMQQSGFLDRICKTW